MLFTGIMGDNTEKENLNIPEGDIYQILSLNIYLLYILYISTFTSLCGLQFSRLI